MKAIPRYLAIIAISGIVISIVLLMNITAPNPTGRRFSSAMPLTTKQGNAQQIGLSAEEILANDLHLPRNEDNNELQCICHSPGDSISPNECRSCFVYVDQVSTFRRPDFVAKTFIAESKNRQNLLYTQSDQVDQISDYASAAQLLRQPLWVYIRVNTTVSNEFQDIVNATGGGIIPYFTVPGYIDPVDDTANKVLAVSIVVLALVVLETWALRRFKNRPAVVSSPSPKPPRMPKQPADPFGKAIRKTDAAEDFVQRSKEKRRQDIDIEDSRDDFV
ncbi:MAG: hypothetical protein ABI690_33255 [Chloroflexota bacterium]